MNDESLTKTLSFLDVNKLVYIFKLNNKILQKFMIYLIENYNNKPYLHNFYDISNYLNFIPLPSYFITSNNIDEENLENFYGQSDNNMYLGNLCLPHPNISPVPFCFGYTTRNKFNLKITNTYYYEITIKTNNNYKIIKKPVISIGFSSINNKIDDQQAGWQNNSIGLHSDDCKFFCNGKAIEKLFKFGPKDVIGCGIVYTSHEKYIPFYTKNGKNLRILDEVELKGKITPSIGYDYQYYFSANFGNEPFKYDITKMVDYKKNVISNKNVFISQGYNIKNYKFFIKKSIKIFKKPYMYHPLKKIKINFTKENIENTVTNNLLKISTNYIDSLINENIQNTLTNNDLSIVGNQINLPGNNNLTYNNTLSYSDNFNNLNLNLSPISMNNELNDPELPNYSDDSEYSDSY
jgi:hypothetical protein